MALAPLSTIQQKAQGAVLLAEAKRHPELGPLLQCLPTRCSGDAKWKAKQEAAGKLYRDLVNRTAPSQDGVAAVEIEPAEAPREKSAEDENEDES